MAVILNNISKKYNGATVLDGLSFRFEDGRTTCIMGPSGSGKSTLLNIVAGLVKPDGGTVSGTAGRSLAYAFQEPRLLPWKTVLENVEFALPEQMGKEERRARATEALRMVEMAESADEWPSQLSGGMVQRVSLARAIAADADILLLDEPFSALDTELKQRIIARLTSLWASRRTTVLMVTHSEEEATACTNWRLFV